MSARFEQLVRAYQPLYLRGTLIEGAARPALPIDRAAAKPVRLSLLAWVALSWPRRGRRRP